MSIFHIYKHLSFIVFCFSHSSNIIVTYHIVDRLHCFVHHSLDSSFVFTILIRSSRTKMSLVLKTLHRIIQRLVHRSEFQSQISELLVREFVRFHPWFDFIRTPIYGNTEFP